jgi:clan AA aspartic protease
MTGTITNFRPHIRLYVKGAGGQGIIEFTIDTGYQGTLTLSEADCLALQLPFIRQSRHFLADGSEIFLSVYILTVEWNGAERDVEILALGEEPLLGAMMLDAYKLCLDFGNNTLTIEESL